MSLYSAYSKYNFLGEINQPLDTAEGWLSPAQQQAKILANLGLGGASGSVGGVTPLTDNSGGTVSNTLAAITAGASYAQADIVALKNAVASLSAKVNAIINAFA